MLRDPAIANSHQVMSQTCRDDGRRCVAAADNRTGASCVLGTSKPKENQQKPPGQKLISTLPWL